MPGKQAAGELESAGQQGAQQAKEEGETAANMIKQAGGQAQDTAQDLASQGRQVCACGFNPLLRYVQELALHAAFVRVTYRVLGDISLYTWLLSLHRMSQSHSLAFQHRNYSIEAAELGSGDATGW